MGHVAAAVMQRLFYSSCLRIALAANASSSSLDSRTSACFTVPVPITWRNKAAWAGSTDELSVCDGGVNILNVSLDIASFLEMFVADRTVKGLGPNFNYISIFLFILLI